MPFARAMLDLVEEMKATVKGQPALPPQGVPSAMVTITNLQWDDPTDIWRYAGFDQLFKYLRGSKHLRILHEWREIIPRR